MRHYLGSISAAALALLLLGLMSVWNTYGDWLDDGGTLGLIMSATGIFDALYNSESMLVATSSVFVPFGYALLCIPLSVAGLINRAKFAKGYAVTAVLLGFVYIFAASRSAHWSIPTVFFFVSLPIWAAPYALGTIIKGKIA